jgi:hypothetical protein
MVLGAAKNAHTVGCTQTTSGFHSSKVRGLDALAKICEQLVRWLLANLGGFGGVRAIPMRVAERFYRPKIRK